MAAQGECIAANGNNALGNCYVSQATVSKCVFADGLYTSGNCYFFQVFTIIKRIVGNVCNTVLNHNGVDSIPAAFPRLGRVNKSYRLFFIVRGDISHRPRSRNG